MTAKYNLYLGEAGQAAASSYFLARGWNVATPRVDIGDDLLVIEDAKGYFTRIQIKTSQAIERQDSFSVRFKLSMKQLQNQYNPAGERGCPTRIKPTWTVSSQACERRG